MATVTENHISKESLFYSKLGDFLRIVLNDEPYFAEYVDENLTVLKSLKTSELCGCKLSKISELTEHVENLIHVKDGQIELKLLLLNAMGSKPSTSAYYDIGRLLGELKIPMESLLRAA